MEMNMYGSDLLKPADKALTAVADATLKEAPQALLNTLHGTRFGHPLHPAIIAVPLGAWSVSSLLDLWEAATGDKTFSPGADAALGIGLLGSIGAAATGLNDWRHTDGQARRVGALHGILNLVSIGLFANSWVLRRRGSRSAGICSALSGFALSGLAGWLGGHLVSRERVGVDHAQREEVKHFTAVLDEQELAENQMRRAELNGTAILLARRDGKVYAIGEKCSHLGGPLSEGKLEGDAVVCPWHGSRFSLDDGRVIDGPSVFAQPCFQTRIRAGKIEVRSAH